MTPQQCAVAAERATVDYITEVGALGNTDLVMKALEMLASKCALAMAKTAGIDAAMTIMLRSTYNAAAVAQREQSPMQ